MAETEVPERVGARLPRGRHRLSREEVEADQRLRILLGMAEAMRVDGYVGTPVADVIRRAGVSRETFYRLYEDKQSAFLDAYDLVGLVLLERLEHAVDGTDDRLARVERGVTTYLEALASEPGLARLFLVEVHAAGPEAIARRTEVHERIVDGMAELLQARSEGGRATCRVVVAAVASMVIGPLVMGDADGIRALGPQVLGHVRRLHAAGLFT